MDYRTIVEKRPDRYVIAAVAERGENNFVSSWEVLSADSKSFNEAKEKLKFFESEGVKCCCIINTYAYASDETEAGAVARMFRLMYGILYMKQFSNNESTIKLVRAGEKLHSKIWGTFVAVLMADQEAKIIIMSISNNCLKNWIYLM